VSVVTPSAGTQNKFDTFIIGLLYLVALGAFLALDIALSLSVYFRFTLLYTAVWVLLGALLFVFKPTRYILLIIAFFLVAILLLQFVDWDSRKPFLRDFYRIEPGMTVQQVDQILDGYLKYVSPASKLDEHGKILEGTVSYQHTTKGWGDADIGLITVANDRVVKAVFYPD